jgi:hypothetical protein
MGMALSALNAVQINKLQQQSELSTKNKATLTHISQVQDEHLKPLSKRHFFTEPDNHKLSLLSDITHQFWQQQFTKRCLNLQKLFTR